MFLQQHIQEFTTPTQPTEKEKTMFSAQQSKAEAVRGHVVGAQNPKIVFMKKTESGSAKELFERIKAVYKGKPKRQLDELLANHEINALTGRKRRVSIKTQKSYGDNLSRFINSLKEENMAIQNLDEITTKQVRRVFGSYERKGLSAARMKSIAGSVRRLGVWLGKDELCPGLDEMLDDPENGKRCYTAKEPKAWEANGVDVKAVIALIAEECPITGLQFVLAHEFGARVEEFMMFRPAKALRTKGEIWISDGTKGGRPRSVPIEFDSQRDVLRRVKELAEKNPKGMLQAQKSDNLKQAKAHMRYLLYKLGITKKGMGITPHGLRHGYACRVYKNLTGEEAPVMGGGLVEVELDRSARQEIAYRMGHARVSVVSAYTGTRLCLRTPSSQIPSLAWKTTLLAVDGSVALNVPDQIKKLPPDVTHIALSCHLPIKGRIEHEMGNMAQLQARAHALRLSGLLARWDQVVCDSARLTWVTELLGWEETERDQRSLLRRLRLAHIGKFKHLADFEWDWPTRCDRQAVQELMTLSFMADASNVMLVGPNGVGKSMLSCNLGHQALIQGHTVLFITAGQLLGDRIG